MSCVNLRKFIKKRFERDRFDVEYARLRADWLHGKPDDRQPDLFARNVTQRSFEEASVLISK